MNREIDVILDFWFGAAGIDRNTILRRPSITVEEAYLESIGRTYGRTAEVP